MRKIFSLLVLFLCFSWNIFAADSFFGPVGNRIKLTTATYLATTGTVVKGSPGEIWRLDFQSTASNGNFYVCDASTVSGCNVVTGIVAEGANSVSGNTDHQDFDNRPIQTVNGIVVVVTNGDLIITYD